MVDVIEFKGTSGAEGVMVTQFAKGVAQAEVPLDGRLSRRFVVGARAPNQGQVVAYAAELEMNTSDARNSPTTNETDYPINRGASYARLRAFSNPQDVGLSDLDGLTFSPVTRDSPFGPIVGNEVTVNLGDERLLVFGGLERNLESAYRLGEDTEIERHRADFRKSLASYTDDRPGGYAVARDETTAWAATADGAALLVEATFTARQ
jgi:hypothetical protein